MLRLSPLAIVATCVLVGWSTPPGTDACALLSLKDAIAIIGPPLSLKHQESNPVSEGNFATCLYNRPAANPLSVPDHVEVHYWLMSDASAAPARFQRILHPGPMAATTITAVPKLGDEADIKRTPPSNVNSIELRRGAAIVTIGVTPLVADSLLIKAARTAVGHL